MSFIFGSTNNKAQVNNNVAGIDTDTVDTNDEAVPAPYVAGRTMLALHWLTPAYRWTAKEVKAKTGKSSSSTIGHNYYADFAALVCVGMVDRLFKVVFDDVVVWSSDTGLERGVTDYADFTIPNYGAARIYWGTETQPVDSLVLTPSGPAPTDPGFDPRDISTWPNKGRGEQYDEHPAYRGQCYIVFKQLYFGSQDKTAPPNVQVEISRKPAYFPDSDASATNDGVSASMIAYEAFTDLRFGMAVDSSILDETSFESERVYQEANGYRLSPCITDATTFKEFLATLLEYYDGWMRLDQGKIEHGSFRRGNLDLSGLMEFGDDDLTDEPSIISNGWTDTINHVGVVYREITRLHKDDIQKYNDAANFQITGELRSITLQRSWINNGAEAIRMAVEYCKTNSIPGENGTIKVRRETAEGLLAGKLFKLNLSRFGRTMVSRCISITDADADGNVSSIEYQSERGLWPALYVPPPTNALGDFKITPAPLANHRIVELPGTLKDASGIAVFALAERNDPLFTGFNAHLSPDGTSYDKIADTDAFSVRGVLVASIGTGAATVDVQIDGIDADLIDTISSSEQNNDTLIGFIDGEIVSIGEVTPLGDGVYRLAILRGRLDSSAEAHAEDGELWLIRRDRITPIYHDSFQATVTRHFKLQPFTVNGEVDLSDCPDFTYNFTGNGLGAVEGLALTTSALFLVDGTLQSKIYATWVAINSAEVSLYEVAIQKDGAAVWDYRAVSDVNAEWIVEPNVVYNVKVRTISIYGERFAWSDAVDLLSAKDNVAPSAPTSLTATGALRSIQLAWTNPTDSDLNYIEVWEATTNSVGTAAKVATVYTNSFLRGALNPGVTRYYWVRAVDTSGNIGAYSAVASATTALAQSSDVDNYAIQTQNIAVGAVTSILALSGSVKSLSGTMSLSSGQLLVFASFTYYYSITSNINPTISITVNGTEYASRSLNQVGKGTWQLLIIANLGTFSGTTTVAGSFQPNSNNSVQNIDFDLTFMEVKR